MRQMLVQVPAGRVTLEGSLAVPEGAAGLVIFAHGSGSSRHSPRNRVVAESLVDGGLGALLIDLLTSGEEDVYDLRFDIVLLAGRLLAAADWAAGRSETRHLRIGFFGASTGGAAALVAAAERTAAIRAVVSRGGRPDLAGDALARVRAPVLLLVGSNDVPVVQLNRQAFEMLDTEKRLDIVPGASHLFEEPGALERVAELAREWFQLHLAGRAVRARP